MDLENYSHINVCTTMDSLIEAIISIVKSGDHLLFMSNGGFGGIHQRVEKALRD